GYKDGSQVFSKICDFTLGTAAGSFNVGASNSSGSTGVNAALDEVALYNKALDPWQVRRHYLGAACVGPGAITPPPTWTFAAPPPNPPTQTPTRPPTPTPTQTPTNPPTQTATPDATATTAAGHAILFFRADTTSGVLYHHGGQNSNATNMEFRLPSG